MRGIENRVNQIGRERLVRKKISNSIHGSDTEPKFMQDNAAEYKEIMIDKNTGKYYKCISQAGSVAVANPTSDFEEFSQKVTSEKVENLSPVQVNNLSYPVVFAHRGGASIAPENTMEAFRLSHHIGIDGLECDIQKLSDGGLGIIHDNTVDYSTTSTGNVADFSTIGFKRLVVDSDTFLPQGGFGNLELPMLSEFLDEFGGKTILLLEMKSNSNNEDEIIVDMLLKRGIGQSCILMGWAKEYLSYAVSKGVPTLYLNSDGTGQTPQQLVDAGIDFLGSDYSQITAGTVSSFKALGIKVFGYTVKRHSDVESFINIKGGDGVISDDPIYCKGLYNSFNHVHTKDPFINQTLWHGQIAGSGSRGQFTSPKYWGFTNNSPAEFVLQGWGSPIKKDPNEDTFIINLKMIIDSVNSGDMSRWGSIFICNNNDIGFTDTSKTGSNGYHFLMRANGSIYIYKVTEGVGSLLESKTTGVTALTLGITEAEYKITVTSSSVKLERVDVSYSIETTDTEHRGGYFHLGHNGSAVRFFDISIS
ncbi:glycerophosphodiester phosphodiesterase [uncultured Ilyobacter sp.]|uniref:glycerophosphodiester phosphodiesterase n=1 Tax=uncultured Ilyobacter sp. TaxID=544433 RepID=UPI0029C882FA|nr:glycerophosphodiester phosphodiesterase [uncultured Ilyobacter sp.]